MICTIDDCHNQAIAGGLCAKHYMRRRRTGDPTVKLNLDSDREGLAAGALILQAFLPDPA